MVSEARQIWVQLLKCLLLEVCLTMDKLFNFSELQFTFLEKWQ